MSQIHGEFPFHSSEDKRNWRNFIDSCLFMYRVSFNRTLCEGVFNIETITVYLYLYFHFPNVIQIYFFQKVF